MFPDRENLAELASQREVHLSETPFPLLLVAHYAIESTGMLLARRGPVEKRVVLEQGVPVDCRSNLVHETLSRFLVAAGRLTAEESNSALGRALAQEKLLGVLLVEEQRIEAVDLQRLLQQSLARKLFDLFTWSDGEIRFDAGSFPTEAALKVKVPRLILTGIQRFVPQEVVDSVAGPLASSLFALDPAAAAQRGDLKTTAHERALIEALAQPRRIEELLGTTHGSGDEVLRSLWGLAMLGIVVPAERLAGRAPARTELAQQPPPSVPPTSSATGALPRLEEPSSESDPTTSQMPAAGAPSPPTPLAPEELRRLRAAVARAHAGYLELDPFDLLSVGEDASLAQIQQCFVAFARSFAPWRFERPELRSLGEQAQELFAAGAIAFARLADPAARESLRSERRRLRESARREASASCFKIETDLLDASLQFQKGMALKEAGKWGPALQQFDFAADCDPQNGTFRAEAAHCRYLLAPTTMGAKALAELREAQRVDPESAASFLYAGEIAAALARPAEAEGHYRKAARLLGPGDRRALDALHELGRRKRR